MTITLTGIELERIDAIEEQFDYLLRRLGGLSDDTRAKYLECIRNKHIKKFTFFGVPTGARKAKHALYVEIDWLKHEALYSSSPSISVPDYWGDGENRKVNPDIRDEAQKFLKKCVGLNVKWFFSFSDSGIKIRDELHRTLGSSPTRPEEEIIDPDSNYGGYSIIDLEEINVKASR